MICPYYRYACAVCAQSHDLTLTYAAPSYLAMVFATFDSLENKVGNPPVKRLPHVLCGVTSLRSFFASIRITELSNISFHSSFFILVASLSVMFLLFLPVSSLKLLF